jgi:NADPH:quinone reductase-like Zn-dependent oxidoreductase
MPGRFASRIDSTYPLSEAGKAHEKAAGGHTQGKMVLTVA